MDQDVANAIAGLRMRLGQLESALGARDAGDAEQIVARMRHALEGLQNVNQDQTQVIQDLLQQNQNQAAQIAALKTAVQALVIWARTVTPPFGG